jgi:hypothetical protein
MMKNNRKMKADGGGEREEAKGESRGGKRLTFSGIFIYHNR